MKVQTSIRVEKDVFDEAKDILKSLGMSYSQAVNVFNTFIVRCKGLPFEVKIPNEETLEAMKQVEKGEYEEISFDQLKEDMKKCIKK